MTKSTDPNELRTYAFKLRRNNPESWSHKASADTLDECALRIEKTEAEVEALRKENSELKLLLPQTSPHGTEALGIVHRSPIMEFGMRNRQMGIEEGRRQRNAEVEALRKTLQTIISHSLKEDGHWMRQICIVAGKALDDARQGG